MTRGVAPTQQQLFDIFVTALEGGIGYWSRATKYHWATPNQEGEPYANDLEGFYAVIDDAEVEPVKHYTIDASTIKRGMERLLEGSVTLGGKEWNGARTLWGRVMDENYDASDADMVVQAGLFNDIVYG